jgi:hypothetical protein
MTALLGAAAGALVLAGAAYACACCADEGEWHEYSARVSAADLGELGRLRFGAEAKTFVGPGGLETIRGISPPAARYAVTLTRAGRQWTLMLRDRSARSGSLVLRIPPRGVQFGADLRTGQPHPGGGVVLYKEWRLAGRVSGTGVFAAGSRGARFTLILQGRGNNCVNAADYRTWILRVSGPRAAYSLHGLFRRLS